MNKYLLNGKLTAKEGQQNELAEILIEASKLVSSAKGCRLYVIAVDRNESNIVFVTEIWDSKEDHDNSLKVEGVRELIMKAMPLLDGMPTKGQELEILGGIGIKE
ncbi:MAG TPA: antibiotic biosynthesis monooxygenase family protein [Cytophagaceae bacterium]|jgi:quinol monooxygenase YgiN